MDSICFVVHRPIFFSNIFYRFDVSNSVSIVTGARCTTNDRYRVFEMKEKKIKISH